MIERIFANRKKVLGMNERNLSFIRPSNTKRAKQIADNKLLTKKVLAKEGINTPKLLGSIKNKEELENFDFNKLPPSFVLKPVSGLEGAGIDIFYNRHSNGNWIRADKSQASVDDLKNQIRNILDGRYSLGNVPDRAFFEERIINHKAFRYYAYKGFPDVRIVVFRGVPVMSYVRLPTKESNGKANMALGAIGAGIDLATGVTTFARLGKGNGGRGDLIEKIPGTNLAISGLKIPYWNTILKLSVEAQKATGLNFGGFDFLIDRDKGPLIVEINARPGLSIQLSNFDGLKWRLNKISGIKVKSVAKGVRIGKDLFGGEIEEEIESLTGKQVIGLIEKIKLYSLNGQENEVLAKIDTGADSTSIDASLAMKLGYSDAIQLFKDTCVNLNIPDEFENNSEALKFARDIESIILPLNENVVSINLIKSSHGKTLRPVIKIEMSISDFRFETTATVFDRSELKYKVIVGRKSLNNFLVDPSKVNTLAKIT